MEFPQNIKNRIYDQVISLLDIYLKEMMSLSQRDICIPMLIPALFIMSKTWKQANCPSMDEWIRTHDRVLLIHKKKSEILPFATMSLDLKGIMLSEINQTEDNKYHRHRKQIGGCQSWLVGEMDEWGQKVKKKLNL